MIFSFCYFHQKRWKRERGEREINGRRAFSQLKKKIDFTRTFLYRRIFVMKFSFIHKLFREKRISRTVRYFIFSSHGNHSSNTRWKYPHDSRAFVDPRSYKFSHLLFLSFLLSFFVYVGANTCIYVREDSSVRLEQFTTFTGRKWRKKKKEKRRKRERKKKVNSPINNSHGRDIKFQRS